MKIIPQLDEKNPLTGSEVFLVESPLKDNADPSVPSDWKPGKTFLSKILDFVRAALKSSTLETAAISMHCVDEPDASFATDIKTYPVIDVGTWQGVDNPIGQSKPIVRFGCYNRYRGSNSSSEIELGPPSYSSGIRWSLDLGNSQLNRLWFETRTAGGTRGIALTLWENQGVTIGLGNPGGEVNGADSFIGTGCLGVGGYVQASSFKIGQNTIGYSAEVPTTAGLKGDIRYNSNPVSGGVAGWIFTDSGWKGFGAIS